MTPLHHDLIGERLCEISHLDESVILVEMTRLCESLCVRMTPVHEDGCLMALHFPDNSEYLYRWGPDPSPVWIDDDVCDDVEQVFDEVLKSSDNR